MNGHLGERELSLLLLDALPGAEAARGHLAGCPSCRERLAALRATERLIEPLGRAARAVAYPDPARGWARVRRELKNELAPARRAARAPRRPLAWGLAMLAVLLAGSLTIGSVLEPHAPRGPVPAVSLVPAWEVARSPSTTATAGRAASGAPVLVTVAGDSVALSERTLTPQPVPPAPISSRAEVRP